MGCDRQNPRWWRQLPELGIRQLADVLECVERHLAWPVATQELIVQLLPKNAVVDRPVTLTQALYRVWGRVRRAPISGWAAEKAPFWDKVVTGYSALRAALLRQASMDIASTLRFSWDSALYDIEMFSDSISLETVVETTMRLDVDYPLDVLALALQMHSAPRRVATENAVSELIWPKKSLMAGCSQSVDLGRLALWSILEDLHAAYRPRELSTWVDDIEHQERGRQHAVINKVLEVAQALVEKLARRGFKVSAKSVILTNPPKLAAELVEQLQRR